VRAINPTSAGARVKEGALTAKEGAIVILQVSICAHRQTKKDEMLDI